ncbi:MAG: Integrase, catalytic region [Francisellaceae bacterium]|nr:Integrase, catalytic region [Francisellaceae bacterium]
MSKDYHHLTRDQRCQISALKSSGFFLCEIAKKLGVHASTISRELNRNTSEGKYNFHEADVLAANRRFYASSQPKCMRPNVVQRIETHLREQWSPEQISGRLKLEGISVSHESIYQHVWANKRNNGDLY